MIEKHCKICNKIFWVYPCNFEKYKTCSKQCRYEFLGQVLSKQRKGRYSKGYKFPKGHKGFRKNYIKGVHYSPKTEFKKGRLPWNNGTHGIMKAWNKGLGLSGRTEREKAMGSWKYIKWRKLVFKRDNWTCKYCGERGGKLIADHIKMWSLFPKLRYNISNGQTLCKKCSKEKTRRELSIFWKNQYGLWDLGKKTLLNK